MLAWVPASKFFGRNGYLSQQVSYWRARDRAGNMRIGIYAGQLLEVAQQRQALRNI